VQVQKHLRRSGADYIHASSIFGSPGKRSFVWMPSWRENKTVQSFRSTSHCLGQEKTESATWQCSVSITAQCLPLQFKEFEHMHILHTSLNCIVSKRPKAGFSVRLRASKVSGRKYRKQAVCLTNTVPRRPHACMHCLRMVTSVA
jgi:hypothetical protein